MAPFQKNVALLSSGEPANSSTLNGPAGAPSIGVPSSSARPRPFSTDHACCWPTLKLSNDA